MPSEVPGGQIPSVFVTQLRPYNGMPICSFVMSKPIRGTLAQTYLRARGITDVSGAGALRFHPHCYYRPEDDEAPGREAWPALISAVTDLDGSVTVSDRGPGVPPADRTRVFERFWRGHPVRHPGAGLGLAIVAEIARAHNGTVEVGEGSRLFRGLESERFYFVHSYAAQEWSLDVTPPFPQPSVTWATHGRPFLAAVENGPLAATQFHPEKSGPAGIALLRNWLGTLAS